MKVFSKKEIFAGTLLFLTVFAAVFVSRSYRLSFSPALESTGPVEILLYENITLDDLPATLDSLEVEYDEQELIWAGEVLGWRRFVPGRYLFDVPASYEVVFSKMARGLQDAARVTVLPGTDIGRLSRNLGNQLRPDSSEFIRIFSDSSAISAEYGLSGEELFSRMLPNTYEAYWTTPAENFIEKVYSEFERAITEGYRDEIQGNSFSLNEIITLASIVEWEARQSEEKPRISGLYQNRLNQNMRLQADPTVLYALGERRRLLYEDYLFDHPYNTYQNDGLPPGPITNPDEGSIRAVLRPESHDYLFMVATPDGTHRFSRTFDEHRAASAEWREWLREQYRIMEERESDGE